MYEPKSSLQKTANTLLMLEIRGRDKRISKIFITNMFKFKWTKIGTTFIHIWSWMATGFLRMFWCGKVDGLTDVCLGPNMAF